MWKLAIMATVFGGVWLFLAPIAAGQARFGSVTPNSAGTYYGETGGSPAVSPYLNLGTNSNGVSNYQTLVRPLIKEREAIERQSAVLDRINRQIRSASAAGDWREVERVSRSVGPQRGVRFMHYSHYFGTTR